MCHSHRLVAPGEVTIELPFDRRFSGPPGQFPAAMVGAAGDVAAVSSCLSLLPRGFAPATLDFTVKMTGVAKGEMLRARGRVLQAGRTNSVGAADVYAVADGIETLCGTVLATTRNFQVKPPENRGVISRFAITPAIHSRRPFRPRWSS